MRSLSTAGAGIGAFGFCVAFATFGATTGAPHAAALRAARAPQATATPCAAQYPKYSFIGFGGELLVAGAQNDGVLAGYDNRVCDANSGNGAGQSQYFRTGASTSFAGAGLSNSMSNGGEFSGASNSAQMSGSDAAMGSTTGTMSLGNDSFAGTTHSGDLFGGGSFMGAGQTRVEPSPNAHGIYEQGEDEFAGAGDTNLAGGSDTFIGTGNGGTISPEASYASVASGFNNVIGASYAAIAGGYGAFVTEPYGAIAGGNSVSVSGTLGFAGGYHAMTSNAGSFVWGDYGSSPETVSDQSANQFVTRASGGTTFFSNETMTAGESLTAGSGTWASVSDRNAKTAIAALDDAAILAKVAALPVSSWSYASEAGVRHIGPMAQDFYAAFHTGTDDRHITSIDEDGVALAATAALDRKLGATTARRIIANARQERELAGLVAQTRKLERELARLTQR